MEDKQRGTKTAAITKPSMVGNPAAFKAGGGVADVSAIPQHSSPIGNILSQQTVQPPVPPFNLNHPTGSQPGRLPPPPTLTPLINTGVPNQLVVIKVLIQPDLFQTLKPILIMHLLSQ